MKSNFDIDCIKQLVYNKNYIKTTKMRIATNSEKEVKK